MNIKGFVLAGALVSAAFLTVPNTASAAIIGFGSGNGFATAGQVNNIACANCVLNPAFVNFGLVLADGMAIQGSVREAVVQAGGNTTTALLQVTNIVVTNTNALGSGLLTDTLFLISDVFSPSLAGSAGVGIIGAYANTGIGNGLNDVDFAFTQAQMNYKTGGALFALGVGGPGSFSLTTGGVGVTCVGCGPIGFWQSVRINGPIVGVIQLTGGISFTLAPQSQAALPGSLLIDDNDAEAFQSEAPEPATLGLMGSALAGLVWKFRRRKAA